ncbi:MAG: oligosaccharide flippase family protein [Porphyromonadaceae bacterium]|nr:oligosaccharide flippase family protein [Porphyromonadaceae bacterium]
MTNPLRGLLKDTAIYGLSTVLGKFLNWMLTFLYVRILIPETFGTMTNLYAWVALLLIVLTMGMETSFFRFVNKHSEPMSVYATALRTLGGSSLIFVLLGLIFTPTLCQYLHIEGQEYQLWILLLIIALDTFCTIPLAYLRYAQRPWRFLMVRMSFIGLTILLTLAVFWGLSALGVESWAAIAREYALGFILGINLIGNIVQLLLLIPTLPKGEGRMDWGLLGQMLRYSWPLLLLGLVGSFNNQADKILFPMLFDDVAEGRHQLGIYSACYKIAVVMVLFTQAFRYAYDPFVFAQTKNNPEKSREIYALSMRYYVLFTLFIFLIVESFIDIFRLLIAPAYYDGLVVVPWIMGGQLMFGVYFNLSIWYKLTDKTYWGAILSVVGCSISVLIIVFGARTYGFMACAWASVVSNAAIMFLSYSLGQRYFPIDYRLARLSGYVLLAGALWAAEWLVGEALAISGWRSWGFNTLMCGIFVLVVYFLEVRPLLLWRRGTISNA